MSQPSVEPTSLSSKDQYLPPQPRFDSWCTGWGAYDVPRIHDIVQPANDDISLEQVAGFRQLATKLLLHHVTIRDQRDQLAIAWQGPAADLVLTRIDRFTEALLEDSYCATTTASALDAIRSSCIQARERIGVIKSQWDRTTSMWRPIWWDSAAADLNTEAQNVMFALDDAIRDHRSRIVVPSYFDQEEGGLPFETIAINDQTESTISGYRIVPPVPGHQPLLDPDTRAPVSHVGEGLAGAPGYVPAVPGQPVSMLPMPPGSPYAPHGGAYILPGPGVGSKGYVVPMPQVNGGLASSRPLLPPVGGAQGSGYMPMPLGAPPVKPAEGTPRQIYRRRSETWRIETGVRPVIEAPSQDAVIPGRPSEKQEKAFMDWFAEIAYPWQTEESSPDQPKVMFRRSAE